MSRGKANLRSWRRRHTSHHRMFHEVGRRMVIKCREMGTGDQYALFKIKGPGFQRTGCHIDLYNESARNRSTVPKKNLLRRTTGSEPSPGKQSSIEGKFAYYQMREATI